MAENHCLSAMKIVHYHANGCFDWSISGLQGGHPSEKQFIQDALKDVV